MVTMIMPDDFYKLRIKAVELFQIDHPGKDGEDFNDLQISDINKYYKKIKILIKEKKLFL